MKRLFALLVLLLFIPPYLGYAQESNQDRIDALEQKIEELNKRLDEMEESNEEDFRALQEGQLSIYDQMKKKTHVGGYIDGFYQDFEDQDPEFVFHKLSLVVSGKPHEWSKVFAEIEFESKEGERESEVKLEILMAEVILNENWGDKLGLRSGIMMIPFGYYNENHKETLWDLVDRPLFSRVVVPSTWSDVGVGVFGRILDAEKLSLDYQIYITNGLTDKISSTNGGLRDARPSPSGGENAAFAYSSRLVLKYLDRHQMGLSFYTDKYDEKEEHSIEGYDIDFKLTFWPLELKGEAAVFNPEYGRNNEGEPVPKWLWGGYLEADYHWWPKSLGKGILGRTFENPYLTFSARYDRAEILTNPKLYKEDRISVGINYRPVENLAVKIQHEWNDGDILHEGRNGFLVGFSAEF